MFQVHQSHWGGGGGGGGFYHPTDRSYGASPDGIGQTFLVEVKTRAIDCSAPLSSVTASHILQSNLEMACSGGYVTFLESYHPEQNCANIFLIERDSFTFFSVFYFILSPSSNISF